jgi:cytoskeleton-associated protein 5
LLLQDLNLHQVLMALHQFFESLGSNEIKRRGVGEDKPLRMAKTLLHELCKRVVRPPSLQ